MPSSSKKQHNFMEAVAHNPAFAKKVGVPQSVGKDFSTADKGRKFSKGGDMKKMNMGGYAGGGKMAKGGMVEGGMSDKSQDKAMIKKAFKQHDMQEHKGGKGTSLKLAKGGTFRASANGIAQKGKTKGTQIAMKNGGKCQAMKKRKFGDGGEIYTAEMGQPPMDPEGVPATKKAAPKPAPKKTAPPKDTVFREGMPVPQDIDGASARKTKKMANGGSSDLAVTSLYDAIANETPTSSNFALPPKVLSEADFVSSGTADANPGMTYDDYVQRMNMPEVDHGFIVNTDNFNFQEYKK